MGGLTTLVDMPLNSFPSTVAKEAFELKSFMCPLGINDFPMTNADHIKDCPYWQSIEDFYLYMQRFNKNLKILQMTLNPIQHISRLGLLRFKILLKMNEEAANRELLTVANDARAGGPAEGAHLHIEAKSGDNNGDSTTIGFGALPHQKLLHRVLKMAVTDAGHQVVGSFLSESLQQQVCKHLASELFEVLVDKDTKKADAAREVLLSEIELEAKKKKNFESKKKNKNQRKNKDPKVTQGDDLYVPQEETEEQVHFPVSYNGDYPSSVIVVAARADELGLQEEELKHEIGHDVEERKLEEKLEYQRQIAEEDKRTNLAKQNKHAVASIAEEVEEMDVACSTDLGPGLRNVGENNCFINVIVQSFWHLRTFRGKFLRRSTPAHAHIKDPCIVCELHGIFTALREAEEGDDAVSPTTLRIAQSKWQDDGQKNDASEAILDVLHWSFTFGFDTKITRKQLHRLGIVIVMLFWESLEEPARKISATLGVLSTKIDIGVMYEGLDPRNTHYLISMVCYVKVIGKGSVSVTPLEETKVPDNP
ncbi:unnamed protein product [Camellia sinensis]